MHKLLFLPLAVRFFMAFLIVLVVAVAVVLFVRWGLRRLFGTNRVLDKYIALRFISYLLRAIGWVTITFGIIGLVVALSKYSSSGVENPYSGLGSLLLLYGSVSGLMWGVSALAFGELIRVLVDIALNTAPLSEINKNIARLENLQEQEGYVSAVANAIR
jgi:hypothetical protein